MTRLKISLKIIGLYLMVCLLWGCSSANPESERSTSLTDQAASADQASPYKYTELEDEYQIDLSGIDRNSIEDISYTLLQFSEGKDRRYSPIVENCKPVTDDSGIIHVPRNQEICTLCIPENDACVPIYRLEQEGKNSWSTEFTKIGTEKDGYLTEMWTILKLTGEDSGDRNLQYSLKQRFRAGQDPVRAKKLLANGTHLTNSFLYIDPEYDAQGNLKPAEVWDSDYFGNKTYCFSPAPGMKPVFKKMQISALDLNVAAQLLIRLKDGTTAASDLMVLQSGKKGSDRKREEVATDSGTLTFFLEEGQAELTGYEGTDQSLIVPDEVAGCPVTTIGQGVFSGATLESVGLPSSIKHIRSNAFHFCDALTELVLPEGLEILEADSVGYCDQLKKVHIPASVKEVYGSPIVDCPNLTELTISKENALFKVLDGCMYSRDGKRLIYVPGSLSGKFEIPAGVREIADHAFAYCGNLSEVTFPEGLIYIGNNAFTGTRLTAITLPDSLEIIGENAFSAYDPGSLYEDLEITYDPDGEVRKGFSIPEIKIHLGENVSWIGEHAFSAYYVSGYSVASSNKTYTDKEGLLLTKDGSFLLACPTAATGDLSLPEGITNISVNAFENNDAFLSCLNDLGEPYFDSGITTLTLPKSLKYFDSSNLPETLKTLKVQGDIREWESINLCNSLTIKGLDHVSAFFEDGGIIYSKDKATLLLYPAGIEGTEFTLPEGLKGIENNAFYQNDSIEKITIPRETLLTDMTDNEIASILPGLTQLKAVEIEEGNPRFSSEEGVLLSEEGRTLLLYPNGKEETAYQVPEGVERIYPAAMSGSRVKSLSIPASFKDFGIDSETDNCLSSLYYLADLQIDEKNPYFQIRDGIVLSKKDASVIYYLQTDNETVRVPEGTKTVSSGAFHLSSSSSDPLPVKIIFPNSLTKIGADNFAGLESDDPWVKLSVYIPDSVKEIDESSFAGSSIIEFHVSKGAYAEKFARDHGIKYVTDLPK